MKIFCFICKDHVLNTTDQFKPGGPYHGTMFECAKPGAWRSHMFKQSETVKKAALFCPRCEGAFIRRDGALLTEHGTVYPGQASIDTSFTIVHGPDALLPGRLMFVKDSRPAPTEPIDVPIVDDDGDPVVKEGVLTGNGRKAYGVMAESEPEFVPCGTCGKEYKNTESGLRWLKKHEAKCEGQEKEKK